MRFRDRVIIVTGAASGIGWATADLFLREGARVVAADRTPGGAPEGSVQMRVDVADPASVRHLVDAVIGEFGQVDVLCNNAGTGSTTDVVSCTVEEWERVFAVNVRGVFLGTKAVLPSMLERGTGVIVNTASVAGLVGLPDRAAYCASKAAVIGLTKQVAIQYAGTGVRCNCVCPGTVDSPWVGRLLEASDDPEATRAALVARQPLGRLGTPEEVASAIAYLASDDAAWASGTALVIDGAMTAG
jgi:NAD(P)-dependent dehydrogenase (short-subunit alcohol dehydrogenase family)